MLVSTRARERTITLVLVSIMPVVSVLRKCSEDGRKNEKKGSSSSGGQTCRREERCSIIRLGGTLYVPTSTELIRHMHSMLWDQSRVPPPSREHGAK